MKKFMSVLLSVVMVLAMTVTAFAAPSPDKEVKAVSGTVTLSDGTTVTIDASTAGSYASFAAGTQTATAPEGQSVVASTDVTLADGVKSLDVVLEVQGVKKGETVTVMQYVDGKWVTLTGVAVADNQVQVTVTASGTVAVCVAAADAGSGSATDNNAQSGKTTTGSGTGSATSPKTGEANVAMVAMLAVLFAGAAVVAAKKVNA